MFDAQAFLHHLAAAGVKLVAEGDRLKVIGTLPDGDREPLRDHKREIVAHLSLQEDGPSDATVRGDGAGGVHTCNAVAERFLFALLEYGAKEEPDIEAQAQARGIGLDELQAAHEAMRLRRESRRICVNPEDWQQPKLLHYRQAWVWTLPNGTFDNRR